MSISTLVVMGLGACNMDQASDPSADSRGPADGDQSGSAERRALFDAIEPKLMEACGGCHDAGGPAKGPFLAGPDRYQSIVNWPGIIALDPSDSILLTYPRNGTAHSGSSLDSPDLATTLLPGLEKWLEAEAQSFGDSPAAGPHIEPFKPFIGSNVIYLGTLSPDFEGMAVTFEAHMITATTLELTKILVYPSVELGVHVVHPLFVQHPLGKAPVPDPTDSLAKVDQTFEAGMPGALGPGAVVIPEWSSDSMLGLAFSKLEAHVSAPTDAAGCKDLASFEANARDQFVVCADCHGGSNSQASAAMDLSKLQADSAQSCAQIRSRINPADPATSPIFVDPDPASGSLHPFKFKTKTSFATFRDAVVVWVAAEK